MRRLTLKARRRAVQVGVAVAMALVPALNARGVHLLSGNFLAFDLAGLPLADPLAALQSGLSARDLATTAALGGGIALALACILGPVFCSWACPYGLLSELAAGLRRQGRPRGAGRPGFPFKAGLAAVGLALVAGLGWPPLLNQLSMPGWYSRLWQALQFSTLAEGLAYAAVLPATLLGLELALGRRLWCRYACPQSVLLALARKASPVALRIGFAPKRCSCARGGEACAAACSLGLEPRRGQGLALECSACGDCVAACRDRGRALSFQMGPGDGGGRESPPRP